MDRKVPDEKEKKYPTKRILFGFAITLSWSTHIHYKDSFDYGCDVNSLKIEFIFGDNLRKRICLLLLFDILQQELDRSSNVFTT